MQMGFEFVVHTGMMFPSLIVKVCEPAIPAGAYGQAISRSMVRGLRWVTRWLGVVRIGKPQTGQERTTVVTCSCFQDSCWRKTTRLNHDGLTYSVVNVGRK